MTRKILGLALAGAFLVACGSNTKSTTSSGTTPATNSQGENTAGSSTGTTGTPSGTTEQPSSGTPAPTNPPQ
jgi:hypothetical protein